MKVHSKYLNATIEVSTFEAMEDGETVMILSHEALENIIHNNVPAANCVTYHYEKIHFAPGHCVFSCTMSDKSGRSIQTIGEATAASLETEMAQKYPATMACKRAFDRAAIRFLGLDCDGRTLSNAEVDPQSLANPEGSLSEASVADDLAMAAEAAQTGANAKRGTTTPTAKNSAQQPSGAPVTPQPARNDTAGVDDPGSVVCNVGSQYRNKGLTIAQIYDENPGYVNWLAQKYNGQTDDAKRLKAACIEFLRRKEAI